MINPQDLRVGNCFYPTKRAGEARIPITSIVHRVTSINTFGEIEECIPTRVDTYVFGCGEVEPVPLTEKIIKQCGFTMCTCGGYTAKGFHLSSKFSYNGKVTLKYVHELQNLYYSIVRETLDVNL